METTQQVEQSPWGPSQEPLQQIIGEAGQQYQGGVGTELPDFSPVAPLGQASQLGIDQLTGLANQGQGVNPYLQQMLDIGSENITNRVNSLQSAMGRFGGQGAGGHIPALGKALSEFQTPLLYQGYQDQQNRQLGILDRLMGAGQVQDTNAQQQQAADYEKALWEMGGSQNWALQNYLNTIGPIAGMGGQQQVQEPYRPFQNLLGGILGTAGAIGGLLP